MSNDFIDAVVLLCFLAIIILAGIAMGLSYWWGWIVAAWMWIMCGLVTWARNGDD